MMRLEEMHNCTNACPLAFGDDATPDPYAKAHPVFFECVILFLHSALCLFIHQFITNLYKFTRVTRKFFILIFHFTSSQHFVKLGEKKHQHTNGSFFLHLQKTWPHDFQSVHKQCQTATNPPSHWSAIPCYCVFFNGL